ncbi:glycosyltransferase family 4 protein [Cyanobacterium aponinum UTEX 3222]|uniref:glycosyltransferase family 4 protein n=1 Tax=Cyanobacterium aponinum TaxID=379064 RepID=UPI0030854CDF|nr:glycosyltransferase family 4 protein [Cyanobacterium aponinum UTEX 3222]
MSSPSITSHQDNILFVVCQTGRGNGGVESITLVIERLKKFNPVILTNLDLPINQRWKRSEAKIYLRPSLHDQHSKKQINIFSLIFSEIVRWIKNNFYCYQLIHQLKIDLVHFNDIQGAFQSILGAKLGGAKIVFNIRDTKSSAESYTWQWHFVAQLSDKILVLSQEMQTFIQQALKMDNQKDKLSYVYSSINLKRFRPISSDKRKQLRLNLGIEEKTFAIGYVASVSPKKNQLELIRKSGSLMASKLPKSRLYLIGNFNPDTDDYAKQCQESVFELGIDNYVNFTGYYSSVEDWYQSVDVIIVVSVREGLARCMIESLACGTPVISFSVCSAKEILINNNCGKVVSSGDYISLTNTLSELYNNPELMEYFREQSVKTSHLLFSESNIGKYEKLYSTLISL